MLMNLLFLIWYLKVKPHYSRTRMQHELLHEVFIIASNFFLILLVDANPLVQYYAGISFYITTLVLIVINVGIITLSKSKLTRGAKRKIKRLMKLLNEKEIKIHFQRTATVKKYPLNKPFEAFETSSLEEDSSIEEEEKK